MSFIYSRALVEASSQANCSGTAASAQLSLSHMPKPCLLHDRTTEPSRLSRFGMTCAPLTESHGGELLTSWLAGFPVRTSVLQAPSWALKASEADSGLSSSGLWAKFDPDSCSLRTAQHSFLEDLTECSPILPQSGLMLAGRIYQRPSLAPTTSVTAPGSLPTPLKSWGRRGPGLSNNLNNLRCSLGVTQESLAIVEAVGWRWPASFIEWMMGWPLQWSALKPLETGRFQSWQQQHFGNFRDKDAA